MIWKDLHFILYLQDNSVVLIQKQPPEVFHKNRYFKNFLQNSQENTGARVSFLVNCTKKETLAQVFSWEFPEIFKNFTEKGATASASTKVPK